MRADHDTLLSLGLNDADMSGLGLLAEADGEPAELIDAYLRRSAKREDLATLRGHLRDIVRYAGANGQQIRHVWFEQRSASKRHVRRREFEGCTQAVLDGRSKTMAVWKTDRLDRRGMGTVGRLLDEFDIRRAGLVSVSEGLDSRKGGRIVFAILSERARDEAKDIALRVKIGHDAHRLEGRHGPGVPPFGLYSAPGSGKVEPHETEYAPARRIAELAMGFEGGEPMSTPAAAYEANKLGYRTRSGGMWSANAVSKMIQSPTFAGMVSYRPRKTDEYGNPLDDYEGYGEPWLDDAGQPIMCGVGVITVAEFYAIRALIRSRLNTEYRKGKPAAKFLGTGLYKCGRCAGRMAHRTGKYSCATQMTHGKEACAGCNARSPRVDFAVSQAWQGHVAALDPGDPVLTTIGRRWLAFSDPAAQSMKEHAMAALTDAQSRVQRLEDDYYVRGAVSEARYEELSAAQQTTIARLSATLEELDTSADLTPLLDAELLRSRWDGATIADRQMLLRCTLGPKGVAIDPARYSGDRTPILDRLHFDWV